MSYPIHPSFQLLLEDPKITDLCFNHYHLLYLDRGNGMEPFQGAPLFPSEKDYRNFILEQISLSGKTWDAKLPFVDTVFFQTHRAHIAFPPLAQQGIYLSLRRLPVKGTNSLDCAKQEALVRWQNSLIAFQTLAQAVMKQETILFAGGTGSGKTTLLNDLLSFVPETDRIITLEDTAEIHTTHPHCLSLLSRSANADGFGVVSLRDLLRQTLRMRPDRILIGECRGDEVLDLLQALNTGHRGTLSTVHANSAKDALRRIELLALIAARGTIPGALIKELMTNGIHKIVYLKRENGCRSIETILEVEGMEREIIFTRPIFSRDSHLGVEALKVESPDVLHRETARFFLRG